MVIYGFFWFSLFWPIEMVKVFLKVVLCSLNRVQKDKIGYSCKKIAIQDIQTKIGKI